MSILKIQADFPKKLGFLFRPNRYKVARGGRGSAKSWGFARALLIRSLQERSRILCTRELQSSIRDSVHKLLSDQIDLMGLTNYFKVEQHSITNVAKSEILFEGLRHNTTKIKSMEGIDICWCEEAEKVSDDSLQILIPTIRKPNSEIWISYNPDLPTDPVDLRFVKNTPPECEVVNINWEDNPWFPDVLRKEKDYLFRVDPEAAAHVWGGGYRVSSGASVLRDKWCIDVFETPTDADGPYYGADWGFSVDPSTLVKCWIKDNCLFIEYEVYGVGVELDDLPAFFDRVPGVRKGLIRGDNARPETISYLARRDFNITAAAKWAGSIEDGIAFLRSFDKIIIHERCKHAIEEARLWSYKLDRLTQDITTDLVDANNHIWDAVRYALQPIIKPGGGAILEFYRMEAQALKDEQAKLQAAQCPQ